MGRLIVALAWATAFVSLTAPAGAEDSYQRISGEGSSWSAGFIEAMRVNVRQFGITVDYNPSGSSAGRKAWVDGIVDFAASDIPFQFRPEDGSEPDRAERGTYAYIPVTAGGTALMYNLKINGARVTNLRLSGENVAKIFTGVITSWDDPTIQADNPGLTLPARQIVPVVRSDGSGSSAQFTRWLIHRHGGLWQSYCERTGRAPACGSTSFYPTLPGMIAQSGDLGVAGYVAQSFAEGAIGYVNYSYALNVGFPVAKVLNAAGYYTEPTPENVAVSLLRARINDDEASDEYLTQILDDVYTDPDPRNYQLSSYSYFILPTRVRGNFNEEKGRTLGAFAYYSMCQGQQQSASLGYSPMPINLVEASFEQIRKIPGVEVQDIEIQSCRNPTFSSDGTNVLAKNAPQPQPCDQQGETQCPDGTGGARSATAVRSPRGSGGGGAATSGGEATAGGGDGGSGSAASRSASDAGGSAAVALGGAATGGLATGGSATTGLAGGDAALAADAASACDADTGACGSAPVMNFATGRVEVAAAIGATTPTVLPAPIGWAGVGPLTVLVIVLVFAAVFAPAYAWHRLADRSDPT